VEPGTNALSSRLLDEREAAQVLGCSVGLLRKWRLYDSGPDYCRIGRLVRYPANTVEAFIHRNLVKSKGTK